MSANKRKRDEESEEEGREEVDMVDGTDDEGEPEQEKGKLPVISATRPLAASHHPTRI